LAAYVDRISKRGSVMHLLLQMMWIFMFVDAIAAISCFAFAVGTLLRQ